MIRNKGSGKMTIDEISEAVENYQNGSSLSCVYYENRGNIVDIDKQGGLIIRSLNSVFTSSIYKLDGTIEESSFFMSHP